MAFEELTREEKLAKLKQLKALKSEKKIGRNPVVDQIMAAKGGINEVAAAADPETRSALTIGAPTQIMSREQKLAKLEQLKALKASRDQPMADKASIPEGPGMMSQIADTAFGLTFPGQLYNQWKQQQALSEEVQQQADVPPAVAAVRSGINALTLGHAPQIAAGFEAPFSEKTYPELKQQYQDYYTRSVQERPAASGIGTELAMEIASRGLGKFIPGLKIGTEPAGLLKTTGKLATDIGLGALKGEATGLAGTYGVAPQEDISFLKRLGMALPSGLMGGFSSTLPRAGSLIGREQANKEALMKPYEAEVQRRRNVQAASLGKAKVVEKDIPALIQDKDIKYERLKENPAYYEKKVDVSGFFDQLGKTVEEIKKQSPSNMNTTQKQEFLSKVDDIKSKFSKEYGSAKTSIIGSEPSAILDEYGVPFSKPVQKTTKSFQAKEIPFSEAHALQEVVNESFGEGGLLNKLRKPLDNALSKVDDATLANQFKSAKNAYQKQRQAERFVKRKGKPEGLPEESIYRPKVPEAQMPTSARAIRDILDIIPLPQGMKVGSIVEGPYHPMLAPTASMQFGQKLEPIINTIANLATIGTTLGLTR